MIEKALEGIRVLDLSRILAGPFCTMLLADLGADVIKVEQPGTGDASRQWGPPWVGDQSAYFLSVNRNKKSITINLKHPLGQEIVKDLASRSDILVENFKPGTMKGYGLDYDSLSPDHPRLIYCSITGYGHSGPYKYRPGFDFMIQAQGGIMSITGPIEGPPHKVGVAIVDITAGLYANSTILAALHHRTKTGRGQFIDIALLDSQIGWLVNVAQNYFSTGQLPRRFGNAHPNIVPYEVFPTRDEFIALAIGTDAQFKRFCEVTNYQDLWEDPDFQTNAGRVVHRERLASILVRIFQERNTTEWLDLLVESGLPASPINDLQTLFSDPQVEARDMLQSIDHPTLGPISQIGPVPKLSETPAKIFAPPPELGEHTKSILRDELGFSDIEVEQLTAQEVI